MKIMLVCAGGMSTGLLMNKMESYAKQKEINMEVKAYGVGDYLDEVKNYDVILVGPQISYKCDEIKEESGKPVIVMNPMDYALGNVESIIKLVKDKLGK